MVNKIFALISLMMLSFSTYAQMPEGKPGAMPQMVSNSSGQIYGKIIDTNGKPIDDGTVVLMQNKYDTVAKKNKQLLFRSFITKANGNFSFENIPVTESYVLIISRIGFKTGEQTVSFLPSKEAGIPSAPLSFKKELGDIKLITEIKELQGIIVTSSASTMKLSADKKVFNVEKNIMSVGGTAVDVMRNVPSVNVDLDGNITVRNNAPQLLVDGRPTTLTLDQIPADAIESVEVITNPSAKYDASGGGAGVLNIVLKKNKKTGYNGNVRLGIDKRGAANGGFDFSARHGKINFSAATNFNQNKSITRGSTDRVSKLEDPQLSIQQNNYNKSKGGFIFGKAGIDYFATNRTTFSLSGIKVYGEFKPYETIDILTDSLYDNGKVSTWSQRISKATREFNGQGVTFGFSHRFPKEGAEFTIDANYFGGRNENDILYNTNYLTNGGAITKSDLEKTLSSGSDRNYVFQSDYSLPLGKQTKLETGIRAAIRRRVNVNDNYIYSQSNSAYELVPSATSNYKSRDNVYAGYLTLGSSIKDFHYKLGVRAESSSYEGTLTKTGQEFSNKYPVSLFPSAFLSQKLKNKQELQFSYSRRVNRPNFFQLIPFTDYTDKLNISRGNPDLVPEFTHSFELTYLKTFKGNNTLLGSVYYKHTSNLITRYLTQEINEFTGATELVNTYINANSSYSVGAEGTVINNLTKWWDISTNLNIYNSKVNTTNISSERQDDMWSLFGKFNSNLKLPSNFTIQLTATYQSKTNLPVNQGTGMQGPPLMQSQNASQGYIKPFWGMDIAFKKTFLKNNAAAVSLSISDIFKTRTNSQYSSSDYFVQNYSRLRDPQMVRLNLSYRFGKIDASLFKRKSTQGEMNVSENISQ